jgi:hypothetical protein
VASGPANQTPPIHVSDLTISPVASPADGDLLFPGGAGDVVLRIRNPSGFAVTVSGVELPAKNTYATGYADDSLSTPKAGCSSTTSDVIWRSSTGTGGATHALIAPLVVAAHGTLTLTLTNAAEMTRAAPAACERAALLMPPLVGVSATGSAGRATQSPASDGLTS